MKRFSGRQLPVITAVVIGGVGLWAGHRLVIAGQSNASNHSKDTWRVDVAFTGGHETDPRDGGRPVVLVAAALKVPADVFRKAFSGATPAAGGRQPSREQVRRNKEALLRVLAPYGVTNDRLDEVSDYYRYNRGRGEVWRHTPAKVVANVKEGRVVSFTVVEAGSGYSSPPSVEVPGFAGIRARVELKYGSEFKTNGSVAAVTVEEGKRKSAPPTCRMTRGRSGCHLRGLRGRGADTTREGYCTMPGG